MPPPSAPVTVENRLPLPAAMVLLLCGVWLLAGVVGHDPWKTDDAIHLGVIHGFVVDGQWLIPKIAGEAWTDTAPLYHWLGAIFGSLLAGLIPFHDAARLATAVFGAITFTALAGAARALHGRNATLTAPLLAIGTLGLLVPLHDAHPVAALLAAQALAYWGIALIPERRWVGGILLGVGIGAGFLADGITAIAITAPLLLICMSRRWRDGRSLAALLLAAGIALALGMTWPIALSLAAPDHLAAWWSSEIRQLLPRPAAGALGDLLELIGWAAFPVWPIAAWAVWSHRHRLLEAEILLPLAGTLIGLLWLFTREARALHAQPLLLPLVLLATAGADRLRRGAANALDWFGMMTMTLVIGLIWLGGVAMLAGVPTQIARNFAKLAPGFNAAISWLPLAVAIAATLAWLLSITQLRRSPLRAVTHWAIGLTIAWLVLICLWLPWIDYGKTYRPLAESLKSAIPAEQCISRLDLGLPQRASLDYFVGIRTLDSRGAGKNCRLLLTQGGPREAPRGGWTKIWEASRPGDKNERLFLYRRTNR